MAIFRDSHFKLLVALVALFSLNNAVLADGGTANEEAFRIFNEGVDATDRKDLVTAESKFKKASELDPTYQEALCNYGTTLSNEGKFDAALPVLLKARDLFPKYFELYSSLGSTYTGLGKWAEAIENYKKYLQMNPKGAFPDRVRTMIAALEQENAAEKAHSVNDGPNDYFGSATAGGMTRWAPAKMPIKIFIRSGSGVAGFRQSFDTVLRQSFQEWADALGGRVKFQFVEAEKDAQLVCLWTKDPKLARAQGESAHCDYQSDVNGVIHHGMIFLSTEWDDHSIQTDTQAHEVDLHEIGHALGLGGHSSNPKDIMFSIHESNNIPHALNDRDANTMTKLYDLEDATVAQHAARGK